MPAEFFFDIEQGTPEWYDARKGVITASRFSDVKAGGTGATRSKYMRQLAGEILTGSPAESYSNDHMNRGKVEEARIRALYAFESGLELQTVGFVRNGAIGASPDAIHGWDGSRIAGGAEIKSMLPDLLIEVFEKRKANDEPPQFTSQIQASMMVCDVDEWTLVIGAANDPNNRIPPFICTVKRDRTWCMNMRSELARFQDDLAAMVDRMKARGAKVA